MPSAITPLANITLGSTATSVTFSSIAGTYRDLLLVMTYTGASTVRPFFQFNNDTGGNYNDVNMRGDGSTAASSSIANNNQHDPMNNWNYYTGLMTVRMTILDYSATDKHKSGLWRVDAPSQDGTLAMASRYASTSAITSMKVFGSASKTFPAGSTFALYGVSA